MGSIQSILLHQGTKQGNLIVDKVNKVKSWIKELTVKREELGGFSICPYAFSASVYIEEVELRSISLNSEFLKDYDVIVYIVEDDISECAMLQFVTELNMSQDEYIVLDDHKDDPTFINGVQSNFGEYNLILIQKADKLKKARETLHKTEYYRYWSNELYRRIINGQQSDRRRG